jgi:hypothetical protein
MNFKSKYFGQLYSTILLFSFVILIFTIKINLNYLRKIGSISFLAYLTVVILFYLFIKKKSKENYKTSGISFLVFSLISQTYLISFFQWSAENTHVDGLAYSDQIVDPALAWIFYIPLTFFIQLTLGYIFDKFRRSKKSL